ADAFDGAQQSLDLLVDLLDCVAAGEVLMPAPQALLDGLRAGARGAASPTPAETGMAAGMSDDLDDLDFEALLDSLHGSGGIPGTDAATPAPTSAASTAPANDTPPPARPEPAAPRKPAAAPHQEDPTVRVDVRRLDAMVNLVGELVLARNRLKTI